MKKESITIFGCVMIFVCAAIGGMIGYSLGSDKASRVVRGEMVPWKAVRLPDDMAGERFILGKGLDVFVQTSDGRLFFTSAPSFGSWDEVSSVEDIPQRSNTITGSCDKESQNRDRLIRQPPGPVKEQIDCTYLIPPEAGGYMRLALLEDGKIWRWSQDEQGHALVFVPQTYLYYLGLYAGGLGLTGMVVGLILAWIFRSV